MRAGVPEITHLVFCCPGRPDFRLDLVRRRRVSGRVFAPGRVCCAVRAGRTLALEAGLEEPGDPVKGRGGLGSGLGLVDLAGLLLTHDRGRGWWWLEAVVCQPVAACLERSGGGEAVQ